jgi:DNA helicase II / ATP-dependent DNA helicase PcrA
MSIQRDRVAIPGDLVAGLNPEQTEAVSRLDGPLVVVAGPGSGKTRVLTNRIAALVRTGAAWPSQVLAVTFTNKAAGEMRERLGDLLDEEETRGMWVCTFHSMCARLLRLEHLAAQLPRSFSILDTSDTRGVIRGILADLGLPDDKSTVRATSSMISRIKNGAHVRPDERLLRVYEAYQQRLAKLGAVDFDDLLLRAKSLLEEDDEVRARYQRKFRYILVDEYQDTNPVQYRLVQLLAAGSRNLCVVGDADQAIYGFRSASPEALMSFTNDWPDAAVVVLDMNYRSTPQILEVCQAVIAPNPAQHRSQLRTSNAAGDPVRLVLCPDDRDEALFVTSEIVKLPAGESAAVLTRTNAQTRPFEEALMRSRVRYTVIGTLRFYDRAEVKDALSYLRVVANPLDAVTLARAIAAPRRGIGEKALAAVIDLAEGTDLLAAARYGVEQGILGRGSRGWVEFCQHAAQVERCAREEGPAAALQAVLDGGLWAFVKQFSGESAEDRLENLQELVSAAKLFESDRPVDDDLGATPWDVTILFLEHIALVSSADEHDGDDQTDDRVPVQLMTAHASKGKEFGHVYVAGVEEGFFPHARAGEEAPEDEERRLLFVACSRAERRLTLTAAQRRLIHGTPVENPPSRFLGDLPTSVSHVHRGAAARPDLRWNRRPASTRPRSEPGVARNAAAPVMPSVPVGPRVDPGAVLAGSRVEHAAFGQGVVLSVEESADGVQVLIEFTAQGRKLLRLDLAPMKLL